jgi:hypothetical protein
LVWGFRENWGLLSGMAFKDLSSGNRDEFPIDMVINIPENHRKSWKKRELKIGIFCLQFSGYSAIFDGNPVILFWAGLARTVFYGFSRHFIVLVIGFTPVFSDN